MLAVVVVVAADGGGDGDDGEGEDASQITKKERNKLARVVSLDDGASTCVGV